MATTTYLPTPQTDEQPPQSGRDWKTIAGVIAIVAMLIGCAVLVFALINENRDEPPQPNPPISNEAQVREQAYKDSEPVARAFIAADQSTVPSTGVTDGMEAALNQAVAENTAAGLTPKGADTVISVTPIEYRKTTAGESETRLKVCTAVGRQLIDKSGKNVRVMPDGSPANPGTRLGRTVSVIKVQGNEWLVDDATLEGPC